MVLTKIPSKRKRVHVTAGQGTARKGTSSRSKQHTVTTVQNSRHAHTLVVDFQSNVSGELQERVGHGVCGDEGAGSLAGGHVEGVGVAIVATTLHVAWIEALYTQTEAHVLHL